MLQTKAVTENTLALIKRLMSYNELNDFTLAGGTALALQIGHRKSIDIDLFTPNSFDSGELAEWLSTHFSADDMLTKPNGVFCFVEGVKLDMITHAYPAIEPLQMTEGIRMSSLTDIAAMKLHAIVRNGTRLKDFTDIYFLLEKMPLEAMYAGYENKYFPDAHAVVARMALTDTSGVNLSDEIQLLKGVFNWEAIRQRLLTAIESPQRLFLQQRRIAPPSIDKEQRKGRRR